MAKCDSEPLIVEDTKVQNLIEQITCHMCRSLYSEAKALPCLHYYCKGCLTESAVANNTIDCPKCKLSHKMSEDRVNQLPNVLQTSELEALMAAMSKTMRKEDFSRCELCTDPVLPCVNAYCYNCCKFLCPFCEEVHVRLKPFASHIVLKSSQMTVKPEELHSTKASVRMVCSLHGKDLKNYCHDCDRLICRECQQVLHNHHYCQNVYETSEMVKQRFNESKERLLQLDSMLDETRAKLEKGIEIMKEEGHDASKFINHSFDIVLHQFEKYRLNLLKSLDNKLQAEVRELGYKEMSVSAAQKKLQDILHHVEQGLEFGGREQIVSMHKHILQQVAEKEKLCRDKLEPVEVATGSFMIYKTSSARIIGAIGDSLKCADPIMCSLEGTGAKYAEVNQEATFTLSVNQSNEAPCQALQNVQVDLCSMDQSAKCDITIHPLNGSLYEVRYTSRVQGQHILKVRVNEKPILGNPFRVIVKRRILERNDPILIIEGVKKLGDIAIHRDGSLIGTQHEEGAVISVDKKGKHIKTLLSGLSQPFGVATNKSGDIYVSLNKKCRIQKYSKSMKLIESIGCKEGTLGHFNKPGRLALNKRGELFVCDIKNSRIQAFDDDLEYLRWYSVSRPSGVAVDGQGDIFVSESGRNSLRKICDITKLGIMKLNGDLSDPQGVYVDNDYVYVVERGRAQLTVLTHGGEFVRGLGGGVLREPGGVVGDEDGYLYVCDEKLEAICIF